MAPGTLQAIQVVVADVEAVRTALRDNGVEVTEVDDQPWGRFVRFADPDGNDWTLQQLPPKN